MTEKRKYDSTSSSIAETPLAHLRTLIEQHIAEEIGGPNASYCWFCHRDVNGVEGPQEAHESDCWMIQVRALLTDLEAAQPRQKRPTKP